MLASAFGARAAKDEKPAHQDYRSVQISHSPAHTFTIYTTVSPHRFGLASKLPRRSRCGFPSSFETDESADA